MTSVPGSPDEVTAAWIGGCLDERVGTVRLERIGAEYGLASVLLRAHLDPSGDSVVVKLWGSEDIAGLREARLLDAFGDRLGVRVPRCLHAAVDQAAGRAVLVLEDLGDVEQGDCLDPITEDIGVRLAESFAGLHGTWWRGRELTEVDWLPESPFLKASAPWLESRRDEYVERRGPALTRPFLRFLGNVHEIYGRAVARLSTAPPTLVHEDVHLDNVMFDKRTGEPIVLDWARAATGPGVLDLAELLKAATPQAVEPMLSAYRTTLRAYGTPDEELGRLDDDIAAAMMVCLVRGTCGVARWRPTSAREIRITDNGVDHALAAFELWSRRAPGTFG